ncbi:MAG TPA: plastocyanin/azurin family copper-binding protein [Rudaea sp.]|nr:plastocyanin/azurin family copper-binding protein [Rudaea sp.]
MRLVRSFFAAVGLLSGAGLVHAANVNVTLLGGSAMQFSPSTVTINQGDTVTFIYAGGSLPHNVRADDNSFRCATSCSGNGGNATTQAFSDVVTFSTAGTFGYYCEIHGAPGGIGMAGKVIVNATPAGLPIGGYISGNWYNPGNAGHGFQIEATNAKDPTTNLPIMVAIWFVYTPDGTGNEWVYAQGTYDPTKSSVTLPAILNTGAKFPPAFNSTDITQTSWGTITFSFTDCNNGTASWASTIKSYGSGSLPIARITQIDGTTCPAQ